MADVSLNGLKVKTDSLPNDWLISLINPKNGEAAEIMTVARFTELFLNNNKIWTANNDGVGSGLDANLLNGKNENKFAQYGPYTTNNVDLMGGNISGFQTVNVVEGSNLPYNESGCLFFGGSLNGRAMQIFGSYIRNKWYVRGSGDSQSNKHTSWREIVFKDELPDLVANTANALTDTISEDYSILPPPANCVPNYSESVCSDEQFAVSAISETDNPDGSIPVKSESTEVQEQYVWSIDKIGKAVLELQEENKHLKQILASNGIEVNKE